MIEYVFVSLAIGLFCNGLILVTSAGQLLYPLRQALEWLLRVEYKIVLERGIDEKDIIQRKVKLQQPEYHWLYKPLLGCATCMPSIWGTTIYLCYFGIQPDIWFTLPLVLLGASTLSTIINQNYV